jgi:metallo-beta-lactamase family protein
MDVSLEFLGAARNVTGSRYLVETGESRVLVDCGLYQERDMRTRNWDPFPVPPRTIDAVLLTHAHLDHSGLLPRLVKQGFRGNVYCTAATAEIARIALLDSAHLQEEDAAYKKKRHARENRQGPHPEVPLYTEEDAKAVFPLFAPREYGRSFEPAGGLEASLRDAGHILGSSHVKLDFNTAGGPRALVFSGDIGRWDRPILRDPTLFENVDYLVMESTYGDRLHEDPKNINSLMEDVILATRRRGGNVVIPSFAIERAQEILYCLNDLLLAKRIPPIMVFIDSPMAARVTEVFEHHRELFDRQTRDLIDQGHSPFEFPGLKTVSSVEDSKAINYIRGTVVIIAGSGMCTGGRVKHHLVNNISRPESSILFVGYQAEGTLGREIVEGAREVRLFGKPTPVKAHIEQIHGFSAHADRNELLRWVSGLARSPRQVFVTHGEPDAARALADLLRAKKGWPISVPRYGDTSALD